MGPLPGSGNSNKAYIPLPGAKPVDGNNIKAGLLGSSGLTARFNEVAWKGQPGGYVKMEVDINSTR